METTILRSFLTEIGIEVAEESSLDGLVTKNFHKLDPTILRQLIDRAVSDRNKNVAKGVETNKLLGQWDVIIDCVKDTILQRRDLAEENFQNLAKVAQESGQEATTKEIGRLYRTGMIDYLFKDLLNHQVEICRKTPEYKVMVDMLEYFQHVINEFEVKAQELKERLNAAKQQQTQTQKGESDSGNGSTLTPTQKQSGSSSAAAPVKSAVAAAATSSASVGKVPPAAAPLVPPPEAGKVVSVPAVVQANNPSTSTAAAAVVTPQPGTLPPQPPNDPSSTITGRNQSQPAPSSSTAAAVTPSTSSTLPSQPPPPRPAEKATDTTTAKTTTTTTASATAAVSGLTSVSAVAVVSAVSSSGTHTSTGTGEGGDDAVDSDDEFIAQVTPLSTASCIYLPINTPYQCTPSMHPMNARYLHSL